MKVKLEEVERYERHVKMRLAFRFGVITVTDATQAVIRVRISLPDGRTSHGVAAEALARQMVREEPGIHRRAEPRPAPPVARPRHRALSRAGLRPRLRPVRRHLCRAAASAARRWASIRWWRPTGRRCSTARSSMRWAGPTGQSFAAMIAAQRSRHPRHVADARHRGCRPGAVPRRPEAGREHRRAPHGRPGRSADGGRPAGVGARQ